MKIEKDHSKKLCCFVIPYFGIFPNTIKFFLKTCECNPKYNWMIFTDCQLDIVPPCNVKVIQCSFDSIKERIQTKFPFKIDLDNPKKLCDFKPAYGYIFQEELSAYKFWGYCDIDQYFGCLENFIPENLLEKYNKIFSLGHMTIYRNIPEMNNLFLTKSNDPKHREKSCVEIYTSKDNKVFDEWPRQSISINYIAEQQGIETYYSKVIDDIVPYKSAFLNTIFIPENHQWILDDMGSHIIIWNQGRIYAVWLNSDRTIRYKEMLYVHIQKRYLRLLDAYDSELNFFIIYPNVIRTLENNINGSDRNRVIRNCLRWQKFRVIMQIDENCHRLTVIYNRFCYYYKRLILRQ